MNYETCPHGRPFDQGCKVLCLCGHTCTKHLYFKDATTKYDRYCTARVRSTKWLGIFSECTCTHQHTHEEETAHG